MRYMIMFRADSATNEAMPACMVLPEMQDFIREQAGRGVVLATEGLQPSTKGARVRNAAGRMTVMDGPFAEAKELVAGFALVEVPSYAAAVDLAQRFLTIAGDGTSAEVRELFDAPH